MAVKKKKKRTKHPKPASKPKRKAKKKKKTKAKATVIKVKPQRISKKQLREDRFPQEYIIDFNGRQAAIRAGFTEKSAAVEASKLLKKPNIQKKLRDLIAKRAKKNEIDADTVLREVKQMAMADIGPAFNEDNTIKNIHDIPEDLRRVISGVKTTELFDESGDEKKLIGYTKEIKFWNKVKSVEMLMRHMGMFLEDNKQQGESFAEGLHAAAERMKAEK